MADGVMTDAWQAAGEAAQAATHEWMGQILLSSPHPMASLFGVLVAAASYAPAICAQSKQRETAEMLAAYVRGAALGETAPVEGKPYD